MFVPLAMRTTRFPVSRSRSGPFNAAAAAAPAAGGDGASEEKTEFNVLLKSAGQAKINVIKAN